MTTSRFIEVVESTHNEEKSVETKNNAQGAEGMQLTRMKKDLIIDQEKGETENVNEGFKSFIFLIKLIHLTEILN